MTPAVPLPRRRRIPIKLAQLEEHVRVLARNAQAAAKLATTVALRLDDLVKELEINDGRELVENRELYRRTGVRPRETVVRVLRRLRCDDGMILELVVPMGAWGERFPSWSK